MAVLNNSNAISSGGYDINNSLRFRASATASLSRTPASAGNRKTWTWSGWVKRGTIPSSDIFLFGNSGTLPFSGFYFGSDNNLKYRSYNGSSEYVQLFTTPVYRDPSAWYHIIVVLDTTQATASNRLKFYVNGVQVTAFSTATYPSLNSDEGINATNIHDLGSYAQIYVNLDGYLAEVNFIDGQALTPSSFGQTDPVTGVWQPKAYTGTYGTNGFYLKFADASAATAAAIGKDSSGNGNNWTPNNISVTSGITYDAMTDSPTNTSATVGNYAVLNPVLQNGWWAAPNRGTISNGNLTHVSGGNTTAFGNFDFVSNSGKWYYEVTCGATDSNNTIVIAAQSRSTFEVGYYQSGQRQINGATPTGYGASWTNGDIIGVAIDVPNNSITFYKNNVSQGAITNTFPTGQPVYGGSYYNSASGNYNYNFGQRPFAYTPPTGFLAMNTYNLLDSTIKKGNSYMDVTTYTGNGSTQSITNSASFQPDFLWLKSRSDSTSHTLFNSLTSPQSAAARSATGGSLSNTYNLTISSDTNNYVLFNRAVAAGYDGNGLCTVNLTINASVVVGSVSTTTPALDLRGFPTGCSLNVTIGSGAYVVGAGGKGGYGNTWNAQSAPGNNGGDAIWASTAVSITNNGTIAGGGGGGSAGLGWAPTGGFGLAGGGGGGGAGSPVGAGGERGSSSYNSTAGNPGTLTTGGTGGAGASNSGYTAGAGGTGGNLGQAGSAGGNPGNNWNGSNYGVGSPGSAGNYADGNSVITWSVAGTRLGNVNSSSTNGTGFSYLSSNTTDSETGLANGVTSFNTNGFSLSSASLVNTNAATYTAWQWNTGSSVATNTNGTITSLVKANPTAGFSIVTYTGTGSNATVGHSLGVAPRFIAIKCRNDGTIGWVNYHASLGNTQFLNFNNTNAAGTASTVWNNTSPTSTTFAIGTDSAVNGNTKTYVAYCWAEIAGFSRFGSYTGNGSTDGPFTYTGFRPKFVMVKRSLNGISNWNMFDTSRDSYNVMDKGGIIADGSDAESSWVNFSIDSVSNGFKLRSNWANLNQTDVIYIYMAFAENPFKNSLAR